MTQAGPPGAPTGLTTRTLTATSMTVSWEAPENGGGAAIGTYRVSWSVAGVVSDRAEVEAATTELVIGQGAGQAALQANTEYRIEVVAVNSEGAGAAASLVVRTLPGDVVVPVAPDAPIGLTTRTLTATSMTVSWEAPENDGGAAIGTYRVSWSIAGVVSDRAEVEAATTELVIGQGAGQAALQANTEYRIEVVAVNSEGAGAAASLVVRTLPGDVVAPVAPDAPSGLTTHTLTATSMTVSWQAPENDGGAAIVTYRVSWGLGAQSTGEGEADVIAPTTELVIGGAGQTALQANTLYSIQVIAMNAAGQVSAASDALIVRTLMGDVVVPVVPDAPIGLTTRTLAATSMTVSWEAPENDGGAAIGTYRVSWSVAGVVSDRAEVEAATTELVIGQGVGQAALQANTEYRIEVVAVNSEGAGAAASLVVRTLMGDVVVPVVPDAPIELTTSRLSATSVTVSWQAPADDGGAAISTYRVSWASADNLSTGMQTVSSATRELVIIRLQVDTAYTIKVIAENSVGPSVAASVTVRTLRDDVVVVPVAPDAPIELTTSRLSATSVTVSWQAPADDGGAAISTYRVSWASADGVSTGMQTVSSATRELVIIRLQVDTAYTIKVIAENRAGLSVAASVTVRTLMGDVVVPVLSAPSGLTTRTLAATSMTVVWEAPANDGGAAISTYRVSWASADGVSTGMQTVSSATRELVIIQLQVDTAYTIKVIAENSVGPSVAASVTVRTLRDDVVVVPVAPDAPIELTTSRLSATSVTVSWQAPADDGGAAISTYRVSWASADGVSTGMQTVSSATRELVIIQLQVDTAYTIKVIAENSVGPSVAASVTVRTLRDDVVVVPVAPDAPIELTTSRLSATSVTVSWQAPADDGGAAISTYRVSWASADGVSTGMQTVSSATRELVIIQLQVDTAYTIKVIAENSVGLSVAASVTVRTLRDDVVVVPVAPDAPIELTTSRLSATSVTVSWQAPADDGGAAISTYRVSWASADGVSTGMQTVSSATRELVIIQLQVDTAYTIKVIAENSVGLSVAASVTVRTLRDDVVVVPVAPDAPIELTTSRLSATSVTVSWQAPADDGGAAISTYRVSWASADGVSTGMQTVSSATRELVIIQLQVDTAYTIEVRAQNRVGLSVAASVTVRTLRDDVVVVPVAPDAPSGLRAETLAATSLTLVWKSPANDGGAEIVTYRVSWGLGAQSTGEGEADVIAPTTELVIGGAGQTALQANTLYSIQVIAMNAAGQVSAASVALMVRTLGLAAMEAQVIAAGERHSLYSL